jgi:hypothetical protein
VDGDGVAEWSGLPVILSQHHNAFPKDILYALLLSYILRLLIKKFKTTTKNPSIVSHSSHWKV